MQFTLETMTVSSQNRFDKILETKMTLATIKDTDHTVETLVATAAGKEE